MATVTLTKLHTEGRLSRGDTLTSSEHGPCEFLYAQDEKRIVVKDGQGAYHTWEIDFGPGCRIVEVPR